MCLLWFPKETLQGLEEERIGVQEVWDLYSKERRGF